MRGKRATRGHRGNRGRNMAIVLGLVLAIVALSGVLLSSRGNAQLGYLSITPTTPVLGSKDAPVTIFEFGDFQCPSCRAWFLSQEPQIIQNLVNTGQAKLAWKDFDFYGPDSTYASEAAYAAGEQGKFWQFHDLLYKNQHDPNSGWASRPNLVTFAQALGLNMTAFNQSFNSGKYDSLIKSNFSDGQQLGAGGTPTFFVVGPTGKVVQIAGPQPSDVFESAVNSVLK